MPQRACDRCHSIRARCQFHDGQEGCERCLRLGHSCTSLRKEKKAGRPRKDVFHRRSESNSQPSKSGMEGLQNLDPWEIQLAVNFLKYQRFENSFVSDSDLSSPLQSTPIRLFLSAPARVKDALLALAVILSSRGSSSGTNDADAVTSMDRCCKAMERLREADVASLEDAKATLFVATSLISVNDMTVGHGFLPIARAALISVKPWHHQLANASSESDPHLIPVLFAEIAECFKCGESPSFRYNGSSTPSIDPSYGVAQELLPHLYDLCILRRDLTFKASEDIDAFPRALQVYQQVVHWEPMAALLRYVDNGGNPGSMIPGIVRHGTCYKLMITLLIRHLGLDIDHATMPTAEETASQLFAEIDPVVTDTKPQVQYLLFPYFVACAELLDPKEQRHVLERMERLSGGIATQSCERMFEFLQYVWANRSTYSKMSWLDMVEDGPQFSIGP